MRTVSIWDILCNKFGVNVVGTCKVYCVTDSPWNAKGDGSADDSAALQSAIEYVGTNGGVLFVPAGTYRLVSSGISIDTAAKPFKIVGAGKYLSTIKRDANAVGSVLNIVRCNNVEVTDLGFDGGYITYPGGSANHGFVFNDCENVVGRNLYATNYKNGGINAFVTNGTQKANIHFIDCEVDGLGTANNGINVANAVHSSIQNCSAKGCPGSPGYGLQFKNVCEHSYINGGYAESCTAGIAFGNDISAAGVNNCLVSNVIVKDCEVGIITGYASNNVFDSISIDMGDVLGWGIDLQSNSANNTFKNITGKDINDARSLIRVRSGNNNNFDVSLLDDTNILSATLATIDSGVSDTKINIVNVTAAIDPWTRMVTDNSGNNTNIFTRNYKDRTVLLSIASGEVSLSTGGVRVLRLDTEASAATDNLDNITGVLVDNQIVHIQTSANTRDIVVRDTAVGGGNISLVGAGTFTLGSVSASIVLMWKANQSRWVEISRANI